MWLLIKRDRAIILLISLLALFFVGSSLGIVGYWNPKEHTFMMKFANFLMTIGEAIIGIGIIGGLINFTFEELKAEEKDLQDKRKERQENREKRKLHRKEMQNKLRNVHDDIELARILIKSHKSGKTYGDQMRNRIMPSLITLKDLKRDLYYNEDDQLANKLDYLQVSLNYMIAYLYVLIQEFEKNYLEISNLQNYQEALTNRMRNLFAEIMEGKKEGIVSLEKKKQFLETAEELFEENQIPSNIEVVWQAMEQLDYIRDFIGEIRNEKGSKSLYFQFFLRHYFHCNKIIKTKESNVNKVIIGRKEFVANIAELKRIQEKKESDDPLTNRDSLTRIIMENELKFDFTTSKMMS
jgi:hypothetical protein